MGHACAHAWAIYGGIHGPYGSSNGAYMRAYMAIYGSSEWGMYARIHGPHGSSKWGMHARIHGPYMGAYMGHMGAAMGHAWAHTWAIHGGIHRAYMRAYMAIYGSSPIGRAGRKGTIGNPFPSLVIPAPSLPLPSLLEGKGAGVIPFPSLFRSVVVLVDFSRLIGPKR